MYNGAENMAGQERGCVARFHQLAPKALYFHCASYNLNLALLRACNNNDIQCMVDIMKSVGILFKYFQTKQAFLEQCVESLIEVQWKMASEKGQASLQPKMGRTA